MKTLCIARRWWLVAGLGVTVPFGAGAAELLVRLDGDRLRVSAPGLHFLIGHPLALLKNGATVRFIVDLTLSVGSRASIRRRVSERFIVSYDLWEEKFAAVEEGGSRRTISHLSSAAAEAWCVENVSLPSSSAAGKPFWVRLDVRVDDSKDQAPVVDDSGVSLTGLIELLSRQSREQKDRWTVETGPRRLEDLKR